MKTFYQSHLSLIGALAVAGAAYGQQPSDPVTSDPLANTAMGTNALLNVNLDESGCHNTASGEDALYSDTSGSYNTATGFSSLFWSTTGNNNTAAGYESLYFNSTGSDNTASGYQALYTNTTGSYNTAFGASALYAASTGMYNTATGYNALSSNSSGSYNTASGSGALYTNNGNDNTASGYNALEANTTGSNNTAIGYSALYKNKMGADNTASGTDALYANTSGRYNTASGFDSLRSNTTGEYNTALGWEAGYNLTTGSNNIDIGNPGESTDGVAAADSGVIRIGTQTPTALQTTTYIAGIYTNTTVSGLAVVVDSNGQLGVIGSSERFKTGIAPMASSTEKLQQLRPVIFKLKGDPLGALRYGLIAEEVAKVYPELVIRDQSGRIDGVRYDELAPMLLNEVQQQQNKIAAMEQRLAQMQIALLNLQTRDELVARH